MAAHFRHTKTGRSLIPRANGRGSERLMESAELLMDGSLDEARARELAEAVGRDVLSNPVIEDYRVEVEA